MPFFTCPCVLYTTCKLFRVSREVNLGLLLIEAKPHSIIKPQYAYYIEDICNFFMISCIYFNTDYAFYKELESILRKANDKQSKSNARANESISRKASNPCLMLETPSSLSQYDRHVSFLQRCFRSRKWTVASITTLMNQAAEIRRDWICKDGPSVKYILEKFP